MTFSERYQQLNAAQAQAVDTIEGPLMVVAGPGTGKTELLSMRAANILAQTDTLPSNILCLTFTESGADAMRRRLAEIIGADAYKVAIHTFHSFGSEIISRNGTYFYNHATFQPASELDIYELIRELFDDLDHANPLSSTMNGEYTHLRDVITTISELKKSGLTSDELLQIIDDNERVIDACEADLAELFASRIGKTTAAGLGAVARRVAELDRHTLPPGIVSLVDTLSLSIAHAVDEAETTGSTKPITAWRNAWLEKNERGDFVAKDRRRFKKLRTVSLMYHNYLLKMQERQLYDFDDMVLRVVHALEVFNELRFNLQEQYTYIMVDEFQDTNLAQSRLLRSLTNNPAAEGAPNIMVVGDDDQAIYSFQGAEISNILQFKDLYETTKLVVLKDNYRSPEPILAAARQVITQGSQRLEHYVDEIDKTLKAHHNPAGSEVAQHEFSQQLDERTWLAKSVAQRIKDGTPPEHITVLARRHHELIELLPHFSAAGVSVNYERRDNVLDNEVIAQLELLARIVTASAKGQHIEANALLPQLLAHPAWGIAPAELWNLSLAAQREGRLWLEIMKDNPLLGPLAQWLITQAAASLHTPLEPMLDSLVGTPDNAEADAYTSPLYAYFFKNQAEQGETGYLTYLEALRTLREQLREHRTSPLATLDDFLEFISLHRELGSTIMSIRSAALRGAAGINLMTAHKSKGLEFDHVYIAGAIDTMWGERTRSRSRAIGYPENLPLQPSGGDYDERLRLFFVAMTRAKRTLAMSYSLADQNGKPTDRASFLAGMSATSHTEATGSLDEQITQQQTAWYQPLAVLEPSSMQEQLAPALEHYRLSATHLNNFLDVTQGGPQHFLISNLLRFPQAISPSAAYGSAIHRTLQRAHAHLASTGHRRPVEDLLHDFEATLAEAPLSEKDMKLYLGRGLDYLQQFLSATYDSFTPEQQPELNFRYQEVRLGDARLTGSLDVAAIDAEAKTIDIIDYKTGKPARSWQGKSDYEKAKLHRYRQQLMFYELLVTHSRDYAHLTPQRLALQFVEPTASGDIVALELQPTQDELARFTRLIQAVWKHIIELNLPDTSSYPQNFNGLLAFEEDLLSGAV